MSLLDDRRDTVLLTPEIAGTDTLGNPARIPDPDPDHRITVYGRLQESSSSEAPTDTAPVATFATFICRRFPAGAWARIHANGRDWDVQGEVIRSNGSSFTAHDTVTLRARAPRAVGV